LLRPELLELSHRAAQEAPVFIVGTPRSGTTLAFRTMQRHSVFRPAAENLMESKVVLHLHGGTPLREREPYSLWAFMAQDDEAYGRFLSSIAPIQALYRLNAGLAARKPSFPGRWQLSLNSWRLRSFVFHATAARAAARLVEKTPGHVRHLPILRAAFPRARFILLHRHPVDVFSSYRRRSVTDRSPGWDISPDAFAMEYRSDFLEAEAFRRRHPGMLHVLPYEELVNDPETRLKALYRFLGEPYEPPGTPDAPLVPAGFIDPHVYGPIVPETKKWDEHLSVADAAVVERRLGAVMERLAYRRYTALA
jgi:hypothetical protein